MGDDKPPNQLSLLDLQFSEIRRATVDEMEYFSLVDVMTLFSDMETRPDILWKRTADRLERDGFSVRSNVIKLKLEARDGKFYATDCADGKTVLRIIQSIPSKRAEPVREWLAELGYREMESHAARKRQEVIAKHEAAGYGNHPEIQRLKDRDANIAVFKSLKSTIAQCCDQPKWGRIINAEYAAMFGEVAATLETILQAKSVRDNLPSLQLTLLTAAERSLQEVLRQQDRMSSEQIEATIQTVIAPLGDYLRNLCNALNVHHVTGKPLLTH